MPELLALGLMLQSKREELGDTHPDTLKLAHRYAVAMADHPERHDDAIGLLECLSPSAPTTQRTGCSR